jgi:hypothetical protein
MNIYFTASISQREIYGDYYNKIINQLTKLGHKVIHEHITEHTPETISKVSKEGRIKYYKQVQKWISNADLVVAELSSPSTLNVGHEVSMALEKNKPVIGLFLQGRESAFLEGNKSDKFIYQEYTPQTLVNALREGLEYVQGNSDTRFNFIVPHKILEYLDWVALHKNLPRSVYLRNLIENDMRKNKDYQEK